MDEGAVVQGEIEEDGGGEEGHFAAKCRAVVTLARLLGEQSDAGEDHDGEAAEEQAAQIAAYVARRFALENDAEKAEVDDEDGAAEDGEGEQMHHLNHGEVPLGGLHSMAEWGVRESHEESVQRHEAGSFQK